MSWKDGGRAILAVALVSFGLTGCAMLHELKPHNLQKLNRGVDGMPSDGYNTFYRPSVDPAEGVLLAVDDRRLENAV